MRDIFASLGFNTEGGEFVYAKKDKIDIAQHIDIVQKCNAMGLPISDDYLYETFGIDKPQDYDAILAEREQEKQVFKESFETENKPNSNGNKTSFKQRLTRFFDLAPVKGATNHIDF